MIRVMLRDGDVVNLRKWNGRRLRWSHDRDTWLTLDGEPVEALDLHPDIPVLHNIGYHRPWPLPSWWSR